MIARLKAIWCALFHDTNEQFIVNTRVEQYVCCDGVFASPHLTITTWHCTRCHRTWKRVTS